MAEEVMKSIQIDKEIWKKLKQEALDRDISIKELVAKLVEDYF